MGGKAKAGPIITDNGNFLIDADYGEIVDPAGLAAEIKKLVGVVEVGLFVGMADAAYFGNDGTRVLDRLWALIVDGSVSVLEKGVKEERKISPD
jgi:ribose 5-phosphate isomerase